jgi:hemin uptake protein HemP
MSDEPQLESQPGGALAAELPQHLACREAWRSEELLGDRSEVFILHNGEVYRLRRTRQGKLILHK